METGACRTAAAARPTVHLRRARTAVAEQTDRCRRLTRCAFQRVTFTGTARAARDEPRMSSWGPHKAPLPPIRAFVQVCRNCFLMISFIIGQYEFERLEVGVGVCGPRFLFSVSSVSSSGEGVFCRVLWPPSSTNTFPTTAEGLQGRNSRKREYYVKTHTFNLFIVLSMF